MKTLSDGENERIGREIRGKGGIARGLASSCYWGCLLRQGSTFQRQMRELGETAIGKIGEVETGVKRTTAGATKNSP